jgi:hypothetical protein
VADVEVRWLSLTEAGRFSQEQEEEEEGRRAPIQA